MKKHFYVLLTLLLPLFANAQDKNFQLGFTASPTFGWARLNNASSEYDAGGSKLGFIYGLIGDFGFSKNYFFSTGFTIASINSKITYNDDFKNGSTARTSSLDLQYIEVPLTIKLKTNTVQEKSFYGQFGLSTDLKIKGQSDIKTRTQTTVTDNLKNQKLEDANIFRLGLIVGGGVQWDYNENSKFLTGITLNNGFTDVLSKDPSIKNSYLSLTLGVLF